MRVPPRLRAATENSSHTFQENNNVIEKIGKKTEATIRPSLYEIYEVLKFDDALKAHRGFTTHRNNLRNNSSVPGIIWPVMRFIPSETFDKNQEEPDRFKQLLKNRYFHEDDLPWQFPPATTRRDSTPYSVDFSDAAFKPPSEDVTYEGPDRSTSAVWLAAPLFTFFILLLLGILLRKVVRCLRAPQQNSCLLIEQLEERERSRDLDLAINPQDEDSFSVTLSVNSEYSYHSENQTDMPPPYSECATNNIVFDNKTTEELPPPYSTCLGTSSYETDEIAKVHKKQSVVEHQCPDANVRLN